MWLTRHCAQPAIDNKEIETLVNSKADAVYRTIDLANNRRGQVSTAMN